MAGFVHANVRRRHIPRIAVKVVVIPAIRRFPHSQRASSWNGCDMKVGVRDEFRVAAYRLS